LRGQDENQGFMFTYLSQQWVPKSHPLRTIKAFADRVLMKMDPTFLENIIDTKGFIENHVFLSNLLNLAIW
jgi:hypothetical protein